MYGIINRGAEHLFRTRFGDEVWHRIRERAGLPDEPFLTNAPYADAVTTSILTAASAELGVPVDSLLHEFGIAWPRFAGEFGYTAMTQGLGDSLPEYLRNLDQMHERIRVAFPGSDPPSFRLVDETPNGITVHYYSSREGLAPFVAGLIEGIGWNFGIVVRSNHRRVEDASGAHDVFEVHWSS